MTEHAPAGITSLFNQIHAAIPAAINGGIVGDQAHDYGYHRGRNYVSADDYSVQLPEDRQGDGEAACGLDLSWSDAQWQYTVSQRLLDAAHDSRMHPVREFYGSVDGVHVVGWDYTEGHSATSDDSHLWHVHLSILRQYSNDTAALSGVAAVITGGGAPAAPPSDEDDEMKAFLIRDGSGKFWIVAADLSTKTETTEAANSGLSGTGQYLSNPGIDQTTLARVPVAK
jgi:hypothetical protein